MRSPAVRRGWGRIAREPAAYCKTNVAAYTIWLINLKLLKDKDVVGKLSAGQVFEAAVERHQNSVLLNRHPK